jgi:hypothetical protein
MNEAKREAEIQEKMAYLQENLRGEGGCEVPNLWYGAVPRLVVHFERSCAFSFPNFGVLAGVAESSC